MWGQETVFFLENLGRINNMLSYRTCKKINAWQVLQGYTGSQMESSLEKGKHNQLHLKGCPGLEAQVKHTYKTNEAYELCCLAPSGICSTAWLSGLLPNNPTCNPIENCLRCYTLSTRDQSPPSHKAHLCLSQTTYLGFSWHALTVTEEFT